MESSAADIGRVAPPPRRFVVDRRLMGVAVVTEVVAVFLAYMVTHVPVLGPKLTRHEANQHWLAAVVAATVVAIVGVVVVRGALGARRRYPARRVAPAVDAGCALPRLPESLRFEKVPAVWLRRAAAFSLATLPFSIYFEVHLWLAWLAILAPWAPIVVIESRYKAARNTMFTCFGLLVILQLLHMVEHSTQVAELGVTGGSFARSHGVIGQLDFETVHFVADTTLWLSLGLLAVNFKARNAWLWVAFVAASFHQIEHLYLFWLYVAEHTVYLSGGAAGIMGKYGLIGTPLDRPYLHFAYNCIVFVPMVIAFWDEARHVDRVRSAAVATAPAR
ncbi:MAG: hypothetical protein QOJ35_3477 [Solirubrobacteraceae bacterium]|jgi:hypothetical protein|nr:hypothetical protein [Solirubrobacteraceae bacterium]